MRTRVTYLSEEPVDLEGPEDGEDVEHQRVGMRREVAGEETHFNFNNY